MVFVNFNLEIQVVIFNLVIKTVKEKMAPDIFGAAFDDYLAGNKNEKIKVNTDIGEVYYIPVAYFFRDFEMMPEGEQMVMEACSGSVLDVGAGAGSHSLFLQNKKCDVVSIDYSEGVAEVMKKRGLKNVYCIDYFDFDKRKFDNIIFLMNGTGIARTLDGLTKLLTHTKSLLNKEGAVFIESADIMYMYEEDDSSYKIDLAGKYYGEVIYRLNYKKMKGKPFKWLFADRDNMAHIADECGFAPQMFYDTCESGYIMKLTLK